MSFLYELAPKACWIAVAGVVTWGAFQLSQSHRESKKVLLIASTAFSETGEIQKDQRFWLETVNPSYALFNCQHTSAATALMLETGVMRAVSIQPVAFCGIANIEKHFPELLQNIHQSRGCFRTICTKDKLDQVMLLLGEGTHVIVEGKNKTFSGTGHLFNYSLVKDEKGLNLEVMDGYGGSYTKKARENPNGFFADYQSTLGAIVFYNKTPKSPLYIKGIMNKLLVEELR